MISPAAFARTPSPTPSPTPSRRPSVDAQALEPTGQTTVHDTPAHGEQGVSATPSPASSRKGSASDIENPPAQGQEHDDAAPHIALHQNPARAALEHWTHQVRRETIACGCAATAMLAGGMYLMVWLSEQGFVGPA